MLALSESFTLQRRVAMLTGGSCGIGPETTGGFAEAGASLVPCARRQEWRPADGGRTIA